MEDTNKNEFWYVFQNNILKNKKLIFFAVLTTILSFGFTITNFSIGVDDPARMHYLYSTKGGSMIQQGRLVHVLFNLLTNAVDFIPFFNDFVGAGLFCLSALFFCTLFQCISKNKLTDFSLIAFSTVYLSYSIINEKFIYNLDVIVTMLSYCAGALALYYAWLYVSEKKTTSFLKAVMWLMLSISSYESFVFLYICGVFMLFVAEILLNERNLTIKQVIFEGIRYALILATAGIVYYGIVFAVQLATGQFGKFSRGLGNWEYLLPKGFVYAFISVTETIAGSFLFSNYLYIREFFVCTVVGFVFILYWAIKKKRVALFVCYLCFFIANLGIHYMRGQLIYRTSLTFCLFIAFTLMIILYMISSRKQLKRILACGTVLLVFVQAADMNKWFYNDYIRYKKECFAIDSVAMELLKGYDLSKPVVFTKTGEIDSLSSTRYKSDQCNGHSVIDWGIGAFKDNTTPLLNEFFSMQGYDFIRIPTHEQAEEGNKLSKNMPSWPQEGYVQEFDNIIVVNMGGTEK